FPKSGERISASETTLFVVDRAKAFMIALLRTEEKDQPLILDLPEATFSTDVHILRNIRTTMGSRNLAIQSAQIYGSFETIQDRTYDYSTLADMETFEQFQTKSQLGISTPVPFQMRLSQAKRITKTVLKLPLMEMQCLHISRALLHLIVSLYRNDRIMNAFEEVINTLIAYDSNNVNSQEIKNSLVQIHRDISSWGRMCQRIKEELNALGPFEMEDPMNAARHHDKAKEILIRGCMDLNKLKVKPYSVSKLQNKLDPAIQADKGDHDKEMAGSSEPETSKTMMIYFMDEPNRAPERIDQDWAQYMEIIWYIANKYEVEEPDIWIRHRGKHNLTRSGLYWEYVRPKEDIPRDTTSLELDVVDLTSRNRYTVALLHDEDDSEAPMVLDIGRSGGACCRPNCGTLQSHLHNLWPTKVVTRAIRISDSSVDMRSRALNETAFDNQKHDLYLRWETKHKMRAPGQPNANPSLGECSRKIHGPRRIYDFSSTRPSQLGCKYIHDNEFIHQSVDLSNMEPKLFDPVTQNLLHHQPALWFIPVQYFIYV
ncbi:11420_t:CDS:10, partial [Acaulospora colombiana]